MSAAETGQCALASPLPPRGGSFRFASGALQVYCRHFALLPSLGVEADLLALL
jgi:hypothetical protein